MEPSTATLNRLFDIQSRTLDALQQITWARDAAEVHRSAIEGEREVEVRAAEAVITKHLDKAEALLEGVFFDLDRLDANKPQVALALEHARFAWARIEDLRRVTGIGYEG